MSKLQVELLQKQNEELKADNRKLREKVEELTEQVEEFKLQTDIEQIINTVNRRRSGNPKNQNLLVLWGKISSRDCRKVVLSYT